MDKSFLINVSRVFVAVRFDIKFPANNELVSIVKYHWDNGGFNKSFMEEVFSSNVIMNSEWEALSLSDATSTRVWVDQNYMRIISRALSDVIRLLYKSSYQQAYDIVDAFHWLPELIALGDKIDIVRFFSSYIMPLDRKWGTSFTEELYNNLPLSKFDRLRICMKIIRQKGMGHITNFKRQ